MKKILFPILLLAIAGGSFAQVLGKFTLPSVTMSPMPITSSSSSISTINYQIAIVNNDFTLSSDPQSNNFGQIEMSFDYLLANQQPTGTGAALFTWVQTINSLPPLSVITWTGSSVDVTMTVAHGPYNITFSNLAVTDTFGKYRYDASNATNGIGSNGQMLTPPNSDPDPVAPYQELFTYTVAGTVLPIQLTSFTGTIQNCSATLHWKTATELNNSYYEVQSSTDGIKYNKIGFVQSKNSAIGASYSYDNTSIQSGINYFRLKCVDKDGGTTYSHVLPLTGNCGVASANISLSPNPAHNTVNILGLSGSNDILVIDMLGKIVNTTKSNTDAQVIDTHQLPAGSYIVRVINETGAVKNAKLIKQ